MKTGINKSSSGFTLIEITLVIVVLGILASLAIPRYLIVVERGRAAEAHKALGVIRDMELVYFVENNIYTDSIAELGLNYPAGCDPNFYFMYEIAGVPGTFMVTATRCEAGGKAPQGPAGGYTVTIDPEGNLGGTPQYL
jgi:prepilin-type N-terminal cleavage/methylation domain-containing protein